MRLFLQTLCANIPAAEFRCVVKPVESAGTDDVFLCSSIEEAEEAFHRIVGKVRVNISVRILFVAFYVFFLIRSTGLEF